LPGARVSLVKESSSRVKKVQGLMDEPLYVDAPPLGSTKLTDWVREQKNSLERDS
jgi:hypothetical protein